LIYNEEEFIKRVLWHYSSFYIRRRTTEHWTYSTPGNPSKIQHPQ